MISLSVIIFLPEVMILLLGIIFISCHNMLDNIIMTGENIKSVLWYILHQVNNFPISETRMVGVSYPLLPWPGVMMLGYCLGFFYKRGYNAATRKQWLLKLGVGMIILFLVLRAINRYGDPSPWQQQEKFVHTILSFFNVTKYPASLLFILITLGPSLLFLSATENIKNKLSRFLIVYGRVPLFYYFFHIFILHLGAAFAGGNWKGWLLYGQTFNNGRLGDNGCSLLVIYLIWIVTVLFTFPFCRWYMKYKAENRNKWWLSYL